MAKKEFTYRGKTLEELKEMGVGEFIELLPSRQRRSLKRGFTEGQKKLLDKLKKKDVVKTHIRELVIIPNMIGKTVLVYNGKTFSQVIIDKEMLGHRLGEFALTRNKVSHSAPGVGATRSSSGVSVR